MSMYVEDGVYVENNIDINNIDIEHNTDINCMDEDEHFFLDLEHDEINSMLDDIIGR